VRPWLVPGVKECPDPDIFLLPVPTPAVLREYGFTVDLEIEPREWESDQILKVVYPSAYNRPKRITPAIHFPIILDYIENNLSEEASPLFGP
jgi:hypothetical protein